MHNFLLTRCFAFAIFLVCVAHRQGTYGELGLGTKKSSAKPAFVDSLSGIHVLDVACGQGSILYVVKEDEKLPKVDLEAVAEALK